MEFRLYLDKNRKYKWKLRLSSHEDEVLAIGQGYSKKQDAEKAIFLIKKFAATSPIKDLTMVK
jgi:uncharacterized protein YegP (UPF0339 family)